ncbi:MAG TPA: VOC family protein [Reyranella sp.]|nr:VOC family protein [Reyranella sp.]
MALTVDALDHIVINVRDVEAAAAWYQRVLGMTREDFGPGPGKVRRTSMKFGQQKINLRPLSASKEEWFTADHETAGSDDLCFLTNASPQAVADHLRACGVAVIEGPSDKRGARGTIVSVYCRDPDGSLIEISSYK